MSGPTEFKANLRYSKDGGFLKSDWREASLGSLGDFGKDVVYRRFGTARWLVVEERVTDDCRADIVAISVQIDPAGP
jgi:hypothetical protein